MLKKSYEILNLFAKTPWKKFTFKEVKVLTKSKSESYVYNSLNEFVKNNVLKKEHIGNVVVYSVNNTTRAILYLSMTTEYITNSAKHIPVGNLYPLIAVLTEKTKFYTVIITGSYARNKQTKDSDLDVVIICSTDPRKILSELKHDAEMCIPSIHLYVFTEQEFLQMLLDKNPNYGKEIAKNNLIVAGAETYYNIMMEAMKNGFNG